MAGFPPNPQYTPPVDETTKRFVAQWTDWFAKIEQYITLTGAYGGGVLPASAGGTGFGTYTIGDLLYAATTSTLARLAGVATGNALISGGVGAAPSWGKIGLTTHVSGVLPAANGGTGVANASTITLGGNVTFSGAFTFTGTVTGNTTVTFPTTGTLATTAQLDDGQNYTGTLRPPKDDGTAQTACAIYAGSGAPNNANGANGDFYFRSDGGVGTYLYHKAGGAWAGIL